MSNIRHISYVFAMFLFLGACFTSSVSAQVLATGETGGQGNSAVLLSANGIVPDGLGLLNVYGQYVYGVTDWLDFGPIYGNVSALGRTQHYVGFGWNTTLLRRNHVGVDVSFFGVATVPINKRNEASTVFTAPAIVVSRPVTVNGKSVSLYSGLNSNVPVGQRSDKLFTPPETVWNVPIGASTAVSGSWLLFGEVDVRNGVEAVGLGLVRTF
ncbi:MAG: hypothetical protein A2816_01215 [Candidatus Yanofskybacteria bacterium RIFCSPHIGHO2_01_FULL_39_44]|nr:MAG: hypothetical protein A2816_01215 [Candidatus Yanofskybacteria bacterium RIFCSPHIGHO2_01_FULL_39_44]